MLPPRDGPLRRLVLLMGPWPGCFSLVLEASDRESSNVLRIRGGGIFLAHCKGRGIVRQHYLKPSLPSVCTDEMLVRCYFCRADPR